MAQSEYYGDQPAFARKDALMRWSLGLFIAAVVVTLWVLLVLYMLADAEAGADTAFGLSEGTWSGLAAILMIVTLIGLVFVVIARLGGTAGGAYLAADLREDEARSAAEEEQADDEEVTAELAPTPESDENRKAILRGARIEDPFGPDGRMVLSYTHPDTARAGVFGDAFVSVDTDAVLNVRTLLHATKAK